MLESNQDEERRARVERILEQLKKLQRDADAFQHHVTATAKILEVVVQVEVLAIPPSPARKVGRCRVL